MNCLNPIVKINKDVKPGEPVRYVFPCGKCEACIDRHRAEWFVRLKFHQMHSDYCCFVTLTYAPEFEPEGLNVNKEDVQLFFKRLRSYCPGLELKYYLTAEYGPEFTRRPHYHCLLYGLPPDKYGILQIAWKNGFVSVSDVNDARIRYVTGYIIEKCFVPEGRAPLFNLISKKLGSAYLETHKVWHRDRPITVRGYVPLNGNKYPLPRYYKEKIYSDYERQFYSRKLNEEADAKVKEDIDRLGVDEYNRRVDSSNRQFIEKVRKRHKKKKQI